MTTPVEYPPGAPAWFDLSAPDLDRAVEFYGALFGWAFEGCGGTYLTALSGGRRVAALTTPWATAADAPGRPAWTVYLAAPDIAAALREVAAAGGTVLAPHQEIGEVGGTALFREPGGTVAALWRPGRLRGAEASGVPGAPVWAEAASSDTRTTAAVLCRVFGMAAEQLPDLDYAVLSSGGAPVCGVHGGAGARVAGGPGAWLVYIAVADADAAARRAADGGGRVLRAPADSPHGRWTLLADPFGAHLAAVEPAGRPAAPQDHSATK
ncbi:VOC family protein [Nocardiopsis trehalosi]|uniref:VOC family protein n=1 Tax=Nocardiopsis trehalosi TaxID=109329 RepID=UPI000AD17082|nr:VOC family protein [Nocardiopsis trehalosi]